MANAASGWPQFARALRKQALMEEMMTVQVVDLLAAVRSGDSFVKARANCRDCKDEGTCRSWFLEGSREPAEFCPNSAFFAALKSQT